MKKWIYTLGILTVSVSSSHAGLTPEVKAVCNEAKSCYMRIVDKASELKPYVLRSGKEKCDALKKECDRLLKEKNKPKSKLEKAHDAYKQAFNRYTSMVTSSPAKDGATIQKALQEYRSSYARYKTLKEAQGNPSASLPEKTATLDTSGVDGIATMDSSDVENNIDYIEALRSRTENKEKEPEVQKSNSVDCESKTFTDLQLGAVEAFQKGDHTTSLELFQQAHKLCPTDEMTKEMIVDLKKEVEE